MTDDDRLSGLIRKMRRWQATTIYAVVVSTATFVMKLLGL